MGATDDLLVSCDPSLYDLGELGNMTFKPLSKELCFFAFNHAVFDHQFPKRKPVFR
jgi:hypothetical protein